MFCQNQQPPLGSERARVTPACYFTHPCSLRTKGRLLFWLNDIPFLFTNIAGQTLIQCLQLYSILLDSYRISRIDKTFDNFPWQNVIFFCVNLRKMRRVRIFVVGLAISILALVKGEHGFSCLQTNIESTSEEV